MTLNMEDDKKKIEEKNPPPTPPFKKEEGVENLKAELGACKKQAEEYLNGWKRAKADYINLKNETEAARMEVAVYATAGALVKILPVYDGLKRACGKVDAATDKWAEGIVNIKKQFEEVFRKFGAEEIKTVGEKFNPEFHEAINREKKEGVKSGVILEEVSGGYTMNGKTIIAAKVIVNG
jgi:molecular chaperone GrpE